ncbi:MAG: hypothetical protein JWP91_1165 [Fibrobacteres bacterium]|nr:hypothetical protein [Fibrobacterota bacterium]
MIMAFRKTRLSTALIPAVLAVLFLGGCLVKDKSDKPLGSGGMTPPWDPAKFTPKRLEGYAYPGPESLFAVFPEIAGLDSLSGDPKTWKADPEATDTLRISQMLDTNFAFPQNAEATMPYGYDDSFRDDTLFRYAYGNGLFTQDHPCAANFVISGQFLHPAKWVRAGLKQKEILDALGKPLYNQGGVLRYLSHHPSPAQPRAEGDSLNTARDYNAYEVFEGVNFYFRGDSLFAAVLQKSQPCH